MTTLTDLNRLVNRGHRSLNEIALRITECPLADQQSAMEHLTGAMESLMRFQQCITKQAPGLEYHHDPGRAPTDFMRSVAETVVRADSALAAGKVDVAAGLLKEALEMEPPPLAYETISKKLRALPP